MFFKRSVLCLAFSPAKREVWECGFLSTATTALPPTSEFPFLQKNQTQKECIQPVVTASLEASFPSGLEPPDVFSLSPTEVAIKAHARAAFAVMHGACRASDRP